MTFIHQCPTLDRAAPSSRERLSLRDGCFAQRLFHREEWSRGSATPKPRPSQYRPLATSRPVSVGYSYGGSVLPPSPLRPFRLSVFFSLRSKIPGPAGRLMPTSSLRSSKPPPLISPHRITRYQRTPPRSPWPRVATPARGSPRSSGYFIRGKRHSP